MPERWCERCRQQRVIEWSADISFGLRAESARCPVCGAVWGVRERRQGFFESRIPPTGDDADAPQQATGPVKGP